MGLEHTVTLLESKHYNRSQIISSIEKKSKVDKLTQTKGALNHLIEEVSQKLEERRVQQKKDIPPSIKNTILARLKHRWNSNYNHHYQEYNGVQTLGESFEQTIERLNFESKVTSMRQIIQSDAKNVKESVKYKCWNIAHERNEFMLSRENYFKYFSNQNRRVTTRMGITIIFLLLFVDFSLTGGNLDNRFYTVNLLMHTVGLIGILMLISAPLVPRFLRNTAFAGNMAIEIESSFGQSNTKLDKDLENIRHLSLGQFFQPGDYLFRFVGYVSGNEGNVLMLRKKMRGSSSLVSDYIDRFSQATLVAINIEEFVDLYTGKDIEKDDHGWSYHIVKKNENWNN